MDYGGTVEGRAAPVPERESARLAEAAIVPPARDPMWFSPLFVLSPARSNSSVVTAMLGQHAGLRVFPELALFRKDTVDELLSDPPGWRGPPTRLRLAGVFRALAEHHDGEQTPETVEAAVSWVEERRAWSVGDLLDHLLALAAPLIGVEKSPESSSRGEYLMRMSDSYPRARYLHLTRHPVSSVASMHRVWEDKGYWNVRPELFHHFCLAVWYHQHTRILEFARSLPPDRVLRVRSEDVLNAPAESLPADLPLARPRSRRARGRGDDASGALTLCPHRAAGCRRRLGSGLHERPGTPPDGSAGLARSARGVECRSVARAGEPRARNPTRVLDAAQSGGTGFAGAGAEGRRVSSPERAELEGRIVERALRDPDFRARLVATPREAVAEELGIDLPERLEVVVVEERPDRIAIVLPLDLDGLGLDAVWAMTGERPR